MSDTLDDYRNIIREQEEYILALDAQLRRVNEELDSYKKDIISKEKHILHLQHELDEVISLKKHIKKYIRKRLAHADSVFERKLDVVHTFHPAIPKISNEELLNAALLSDRENLKNYNDTYKESRGVKIYRKAKRLARRAKQGGKL